MESTPVATIITRARRRCDAETATPTADFITDAELLDFLNSAQKELVDQIADSSEGGLELYATMSTLTSPYSLPADFYRPVALDVPGSGVTSWITAPQFNFQQRNNYTSTERPMWRIVGGTLLFSPSTATPTSVRLWYIPVRTAATSSDSIITYNGWDDYLVGKLMFAILEKEERDTAPANRMVTGAVARIERALMRYTQAATQRAERLEFTPEDLFDVDGR
jgi:hypothetical protein